MKKIPQTEVRNRPIKPNTIDWIGIARVLRESPGEWFDISDEVAGRALNVHANLKGAAGSLVVEARRNGGRTMARWKVEEG
jgi:hypothetical protein